LRNHAKATLACDFFVAVTATFRVLYVFVVIEHGTGRLKHVNVTANPTADWTLQQLREVVGDGASHKYLLHDQDGIFAGRLDKSIKTLGIEVLRSPIASPKANATRVGRTEAWGLGCRIRRRKWRYVRGLNPDIDWRRVRSCSQNRCWVGFTMSTHRCRRASVRSRVLENLAKNRRRQLLRTTSSFERRLWRISCREKLNSSPESRPTHDRGP
jgi:hypothetical protein